MVQRKEVRLIYISKKLVISTVTVSKALSNKEGVGDDLRIKIKQLAEEMGYKVKSTNLPNTKNGTLTGNIGILIPNKFFSQGMSFYWYVFNNVSTELLKKNYYSVLELLSDEDEKNLTLPRMIQDSKVDGLIILGQISPEYIESLNSRYENFILLDFYNQSNYDCVANDDYYCSYLLTNYVISQGHKKLRFVGNINATSSICDRFMGFQKAMIENNLCSDFSQAISDRNEHGKTIPIELPLDDMPTAFICNNDDTAAMVIEKLNANGYKVPEDISVTGFDNFSTNNSLKVPLTTVWINPEDTAKTATDLLIKKLNGEPYIKGRHIVGGTVIIRDSVKKID